MFLTLGGVSTYKNELKRKNKIFSSKASFPRKLTLNVSG